MTMRVRHILPGFGRLPPTPETGSMSGIVSAAYNLARQQAVEGWEVDLIGLASQHLRTGDAYWAHGLRVMPVRPWHWCRVCSYDFRYLAPLTASLQRESPADVHQVYSNPYLLVPGRAAKRVIRYSTPIGEVPKAYSRALQRADAVICCSGFIRDQFVGRVTYPEGRVYVVRGGVDLGVFQPGNRHASREWLKIDPGDTVILFAGQVNEEKGLLHVVRACRQLSRDYDLHLMVAGSSSLWGSIDNPNEWMAYERRVVEEASALRASLLGRVPHGRMPAVYQAADIFV
jgi:glycosyltransferase involved in cell wall biosynthesis